MSGPPTLKDAPRVRIVHANASQLHERVGEGMATLTFADPPYNIGLNYEGSDTDSLPPAEYEARLNAWIKSMARATRAGGMVALLISEEWADIAGASMTRIVGPRHRRVIWHETFAQYNRFDITRGHRHLFLHRVPGGSPFWNPAAIKTPSVRQLMGDKRAKSGGRIPDDVWDMVEVEDQGGIVKDLFWRLGASDLWKVRRLQGTATDRVDWHTAQLPPELLQRLVLAYTKPWDLIAESFSGSASLGRVAARLGRRYRGVDTSGKYVKLGNERIAAEVFGCDLENGGSGREEV